MVFFGTWPRLGNPCPERIATDAMNGMTAGMILGAILMVTNDILNSVSLSESLHDVLYRTLLIGVSVCLLVGTFTMFECTIEFVRGGQQPIDSFLAGGLTGAFVGAQVSAKGAIVNALFYAFVFGFLATVL